MKLILGRNPTELWHSLVSEAEIESEVNLGEEIESYLVFTLGKYTYQPHALTRPLSLDYLEALQQQRPEDLRDTSDRGVIQAGLFPGLIERRAVTLRYIVGIVRSGYDHFADHKKSQRSLFKELSNSVDDMIGVLHKIRTLGLEPYDQAAHAAWRNRLLNRPSLQ